MNRPATKYNSLPSSKSEGAKIVVGRYGRNGKAIEQRLDQERRGLRRWQLQEGQHMLLSKLIHEIGGLHGC